MKRFYPQYPFYPANSNFPYPYHYPYRQYPPINTKLFIQSANKTLSFIKDAEKIVEKLAKSEVYSKNLMILAQQSKVKEVKKMMVDIGLKTNPEVHYTPSGLVIRFSAGANELNCCLLQMNIRWGD